MNKKNKFFLKKIQYSALGSIIVLKHSLLHDSVPNIYVLASRKYICCKHSSFLIICSYIWITWTDSIFQIFFLNALYWFWLKKIIFVLFLNTKLNCQIFQYHVQTFYAVSDLPIWKNPFDKYRKIFSHHEHSSYDFEHNCNSSI